jgi:hypothetical protein
MLSSRLLDDVFMFRLSQTRDNICGVKGDSHGTRTHHITDARRACYPLHHVYCLWFDSHRTRTHDLRDARRADNKRGVKGSMLSSRLLDDVFMSRVNQTRDNIRGVKGSMLSSRFKPRILFLVWLTRDTNTWSNRREESMLPFTPRILSLVWLKQYIYVV